jgi:hypothetical protein
MRISHHQHTGRYLPRHHTSYAALMLVTLCAGFVMLAATANTLAVQNPQSGSVAIGGVMPGPAPTQAATILQPTAGQRFTSLPITVTGTCSPGLVVQIYKNNVFAGSTPCSDQGGFSVQIDLFSGQNVLIAKVVDALDQPGPDSRPVPVTYTPTGQVGNFVNQVTQPLFVKSDAVTRGVSPNSAFNWIFEIVGGQSPYAVSIDWGDGRTDLISQQSAGQITSRHAYSKPGNYKVIIKATDSAGNRAYLQTLVVVNGALNQPLTPEGGLALKAAWPLYLSALLIVASFWLGEMYKAWRIRRQVISPPTPL